MCVCVCVAGLAPQDKLWAGLGALSRIINERDRRNTILSMHNAELRAAAAAGDDVFTLQVSACLHQSRVITAHTPAAAGEAIA